MARVGISAKLDYQESAGRLTNSQSRIGEFAELEPTAAPSDEETVCSRDAKMRSCGAS